MTDEHEDQLTEKWLDASRAICAACESIAKSVNAMARKIEQVRRYQMICGIVRSNN